MKKLLLIATAALSAMFGSTASADGLRADWMAGKRGMMVHWLFAEAGQIDYYANGFDINKFMADFDATKSDYLIFTIGQNKGTYASPNAKLAELGIPSGCCATRDLVGEIAAAVHARGKKFIAYLPCEVNQNDTVKTLLGWSDRAEFQEKYCAVITEWATRWGTNLDGWWIDGFYNDDGHWASSKGFDQSAWATALRAGNPNAVVTLNPGLNAQTPRSDVLNDGVLSDYLAGEINSPSAINWTLKEFADDATCRTHFLMPIDGCWGAYWPWSMAGGANPYNDAPNQETMNRLSYVGQFPDPVVSESDLSAMIQSVFAVNGAVTINVGVNTSGTLNPASVALLAKMPGGSESASAPKGTTVESLIGSWSSTPMASDGTTFSTDGDLVYAYSTASADKTVNGIIFTGLGSSPATASADFEFSPAFNTTQNAESDGMSGDLETIAKLAWKNSEKTTKGYATMTFKGLTAGKRYCIQLYIHDTYCHSSAVFGPDAKSTVIYRSEDSDPKSGKDWTCGGVFTGVITAKGTTHEIMLNYPTTDRIELNALQVRCLGDAIVRPEDAPVAEESVIDAKTWQELFPDSLKGTYLDTDTEFSLPYRQHAPTTADGVKYPLVIFLHGAGEVGTDNWKQVGSTANDVIPITKYAMKHGDAFVLAPQCPGADGNDYSMTWSGANWNSYPMTRLETPTKPMAALVKLITEFMANNPVDPTRVYVTGLSMGGFGTWDLASRMTTTFAAVMPCCGGADANAAELYRGQSIRFFHGSSDNTVVPEFSRAMSNALTQAAIPYEYVEYQGCNHVDCWKKAYVDTEDNLEWLFGHIKGETYVAPDHGDTTPNAPLSTVSTGGWLGWKMSASGSTIVDVGTKIWAYAQNYSVAHSGQPLTVNGVAFAESGLFSGLSSVLSCDKTFSDGKDSFGTEGLNDGESDFARMLKTGWEAAVNQGPEQTYTLHGLTSGKMYLVQFVYHCAARDRAAVRVAAPDGVASVRVSGLESDEQSVDENWRYGGTLIGVFTAEGTEKSFKLTYSRECCYLLNAVQLREVTSEQLAADPVIVYGTPTIGSVTANVSGTTATLTLAGVDAGENGGCYQVWLAYAEDGETLGDEEIKLYSQQSSSCAVEIKNLTPGKMYNCSIFVKNEGNVISEKKSGSFTIPGGGSDPVDPPSGDDPETPSGDPVGSWVAKAVSIGATEFATTGTVVWALTCSSGDPGMKHVVNGIEFAECAPGTWSDNNIYDFIDITSYFTDSKDKFGYEDYPNHDANKFGGMLARGWACANGKGSFMMTVKNLEKGNVYLLQIFAHTDGQSNEQDGRASDTMTAPDDVATITYGGTGWKYGGTLIGTFVATNTAHSFTFTHDRATYFQINSIQLRDLGAAPEEGGDDPEPVEADPDTSWMPGSFGVSFHWTAKVVNNNGTMNWEQAVNNFDAEKFADSVESFGAQHVIFTVAHAWQQLPCPCTALDKLITGRTTTRDLMQDIIDELTSRNIRVIFYYNHSCNHGEDAAWQAASGYNDITDETSMAAFGSNICTIVRELSLRYGDGVLAWWFDSATSVDDSQPWPKNKTANNVAGLRFPWDNLFAAARAGNPHAAVAVNWDVHAVDQHGLATDYLSGETEKINAYGNFFPFAPEGFQDHIWTRMDSSDWFWQGGDVANYGSRFSGEQLAWWKVSHRDAGRMATLNLVIDEAGNINPVVAEQLVNAKTIGKVWSQGRYDPTKWQAAPAASNLVLGTTGEFTGVRKGGEYGSDYDKTSMAILSDGKIANSTNDGDLRYEKDALFGANQGGVFAWTFESPSDVYGLNIYSRCKRSNDGKDAGNDEIIVASVEVKADGSDEWIDMDAPALYFGEWDGVSGGALAARLVDDTGVPLAKNVTAIRFTLGEYKNGGPYLTECEVIGCKAEGGGGDDDPDVPESGWAAVPMDASGDAFSREGDPVFAFMRDRSDAGTTIYKEMLPGLYFNWIYLPTDEITSITRGAAIDGVDGNGHNPSYFMTMNPAFNSATDRLGDGGLTDGNDGFAGMLMRAWTGSTLDDVGDGAGQATLTLNNLTADRKYCLQIFIHEDNPVKLKGIKAPDGTIAYAGNFDSVADCPRGSVLTCVFTSTGTSQSFNLVYLDRGGYQMNAIQLRDLGEADDDPEPEEPEVIPVYMLTIPAKTGLVLDSVTTNSVPVEATENAYSIVSNTEVTITFTAASGYELDANDGIVTMTIEANYTFGEDDYPAVKEQQGEEPEEPDQPVDPQPGELVNGRANMKGWAMKRISTPAAAPTVVSDIGLGWGATDNPTEKSYSGTAQQGAVTLTFAEAQVVNTIQLFAPSSDMIKMPYDFKVSGSNDGTAWTELLSVTGESNWFAREVRYYTFNNTAAYTQYKLSVESTVSGGAVKLGVFNYFFTKAPDPTTPWTWANGTLSRGDQSINNVSKESDCLSINYNNNHENIYDFDLTAGIVDADGAKIDLPVKLNTRFKGSVYLTRVVASESICQVGEYGFENCYMLNEVVLGEGLTAFNKGAFKKAASLQFVDMSKAAVPTLPGEIFMNAYNVCGDLEFSVLTNSASFQNTMITSVSFPKIESFGDGGDWMAALGLCPNLTNIVFGANLKTVNCGQFLGKITGPATVYWNSAPPTFEKGETSVFSDKADWTVTNYLPLSKQSQWEAYAAAKGNNFTLPDGDTPGTWNSGKKAYVRWWDDRPPVKSGFILIVR